MPRFITDTIDEPLRIALISQVSSLQTTLQRHFEEQDFVVQMIAPTSVDQYISQSSQDTWYKVVYLISPQESSQEVTETLSQLSSFLPKLQVVLSLSPATNTWSQHIEREREIFSHVSTSVSRENIVLTSNTPDNNQLPWSFIFSQASQGVIQDPVLQVDIVTVVTLGKELAKQLLLPNRGLVYVHGRQQSTTSLCRDIAQYYQQVFHRQLLIQTQALLSVSHPVLVLLNHQYREQLVASNDVGEAVQTMIRTPFPSPEASRPVQPPSSLSKPDKQDRLEDWNQPIRVVRIAPEVVEEVSVVETEVEVQIVEEAKASEEKQENIDESINSIFHTYRQDQRTSHLQTMTAETRRGTTKLKHNTWLFRLGLGISGVGVGLIVMVGMIGLSGRQLHNQFMSYLESRSQPITAQDKQLQSLSRTSSMLSWELDVFTKKLSFPIFPKTVETTAITQRILDISEQEKTLQASTQELYQQIMRTKEGESLTTLSTVHTQTAALYQDISLLLGQLKDYSVDTLSPTQKELIGQYKKDLEEKQTSLAHIQQLYPLLPALLGENEKRTYAFVFQNEQELRPTGGFIQAVALVTFDKGTITATAVKDIYTIDEQLPVFVDPPNEIKQFLGEVRWFTRDSNWNPDFPTSAKQLSFFLEKSFNQSIDGIVAINSESLMGIINGLGQVSLPKYNEVVTAHNLAERLEFNSEIQLVNKEERPDYSALLLTRVLEGVKNLHDERGLEVLSAFETAAQEKELLLYLGRPAEEATAEVLGWSGSVVEPTCPALFTTEQCVVDSMFEVEANIGVNKANYYLQRQVEESIQLSSTQAIHSRVISLKNTAQSNAWPKGSYRAFSRLYVNSQATLTDITIDGVSIRDQVSVYEENNHQVWAFISETPIQDETRIEVTYATPLTTSATSPFTYVFFDQKQPGARDTSPRVFLRFDPNLTPTLIAPQADVQGNVIVFNPSKDTGHTFIGATFK